MHNTNRPTISTHVLDVSRGAPAAGVSVTLARLERAGAGGGAAVAPVTRETDADGRIAEFGTGDLQAGEYRLVFDVGAYFRRQGDESFFTQVTLDLHVADPHRRHHVPLLVSPYSCASYRGS